MTVESWTRSSTVSAGRVERAGIVLSVAGGAKPAGTARAVGVSRPTVITWLDRFAAQGIAGLVDEPRSGRPRMVDDAATIAATLDPPPESLAVTHSSSRLLGAHLGVGDATVARAWRSQLVTAISAFIEGWNDRCHPFIWTKTADESLPHATRQRDSDAGH